MVEAEGSGISSECHSRSNFRSGKGVAVTDIRKVWREQERVGGGKHGQRRIGERWGTLVFWDGDR